MSNKAEWRIVNGQLKAFLGEVPVTWFPQPGSQDAFLRCSIYEALLTGNRGGGKTDTLIMDFAQHVGRGYGSEWRGILFRRTYPELDDVVNKSRKWFKEIWPEDGPNPAQFNVQKMTWTWRTGETLVFRHMSKENDYWSYHGHAYPWIGWEEITTWPDSGCYKRMFSCCRSSHPAVAKIARVRATTNPYGPGHNWVKRRFRLPIIGNDRVIGPIIRDSKNKAGDLEPPRVAVRSSLAENKILLIADPGYIQRIKAAARNEAELAAWIDGSWDITCGGMLDDLWNRNIHIIEDIPFIEFVKARWFLNRAYDHGQSRPFSVGWFAESNGISLEWNGKIYGPVKGDIILFAEWYGCVPGEENEGIHMPSTQIAEGILEREMEMGLKGRIKRGPADSQIFAREDGKTTVAGKMKAKRGYWDKC
ncbi:MAG: hypothetical protein KAS32_06830, partial [Candidatus Peribacteraceae bacterium]|nr:hypothetical protein [Candidatus Peribacteraceae bacterium]